MSRVAWPSVPFETWLKGFPCYARIFNKDRVFARSVALAFWYSMCTPEVYCARCFGCYSGLDGCIVDYPFKGYPDEKKILFR